MYPRGRSGGAKHRILVCLLALVGLLSCGLEAFYYIDYIPQGNYFGETRATIRLPSSGSEGYGDNQYFTHFIIFYRIYLSDNNPTGVLNSSGDSLTLINPTLVSDYNWSITYTDITSTTVNTSNLESTFRNRRYYKLELKDERIDNVLDRGVLGNTLEISFYDVDGQEPRLILDSNEYILQRLDPASVPGYIPSLKPTDSRSFLNDPELRNPDNATQEINIDVATNTRGEIRYTYVSMYIAAVGRSFDTPPATIYSQPTFLGIFRLPNP